MKRDKRIADLIEEAGREEAEFIPVRLRRFLRNGEVTIKQRLFRLAEMTGRPLDMALHHVAWLTPRLLWSQGP
jgi:hypothetical protein